MNFTKKFIRDIFNKFEDEFKFEEVEELLSIENDYEYDTIHNKRLIVRRIKFSGTKNTGDEILFDQEFSSGVNLIIADNNKGKSSILKIIKFCLTGNISIQEDVLSWLDTIYLEFSLNNTVYTVLIQMPNEKQARQYGGLYQLSIPELENIEELDDTENPLCIFYEKTIKKYQNKIEGFFFKNFEFYNLQWTQKSSNKNSTDLSTANASWKTYYSGALNLESKDSYKLFYGGQAELCFQMLLGLKYTYPINRLKIKKEKLEYNLALLKNKKGDDKTTKQEKISEIDKKIDNTNKQIDNLSLNAASPELEKLMNRSKEISENIVNIQNTKIEANKEKTKLSYKLSSLDDKYKSTQSDIHKHTQEKNRLIKKINDLKEYVDIGVFFTNLDIHSCPHCNHEITKAKRKKEKDHKECMLCDHKVEEPISDPEVYTNKLQNHEQSIQQIEKELELYKTKLTKLQIEKEAKREEIKVLNKDIGELSKKEINLIEVHKKNNLQYNAILEKKDNTKKIILLQKELAVLEYRKKQLNKDDSQVDISIIMKFTNKIRLLEKSIEELKELRANTSQMTIKKLENFMFSELKELGLSSVQAVSIRSNFKVYLQINDIVKPIEKVTEGEILRAKLSLFLSIIQLGIGDGQGKHPRFLIIDSPAKEEADKKFIKGLSTIIEEINKKYSAELQIIIGTAERKLENVNISGKKHVIPEDDFVF